MTFKEAVDIDFPEKYKSGIQAVKGSDRDKFDFLKSSRNINGSIDIDSALKKEYPEDNRWDYSIGYKDVAYFFEVHPMTEKEIATIIKKSQWLKKILSDKAMNLNSIRDKSCPFFWLSTDSGCDIPQKSKKARLLSDYNIEWRKTEIQKIIV